MFSTGLKRPVGVVGFPMGAFYNKVKAGDLGTIKGEIRSPVSLSYIMLYLLEIKEEKSSRS